MIRFGPHIKDISATWANRVHKKAAALNDQIRAKGTMKHHHNFLDKNKIVLARQIKKEKIKVPKVVTQSIRQQAAISQSIPIASQVVTSAVPVAAYKFTPNFTNAQGNNITAAANNIINMQQPLLDNGGVTNAKGSSGMPLIVKSWSLLKNMPQNTAGIITQPLNILQGVPGGKTCFVLQQNPPNSAAGLINMVSQPQVSLAYNFNPGAIISQPITTFAQSNLMQRIVVNPAGGMDQIDQNATNLSLKDNQFILSPGVGASDALNTITIQPQPTSPLPVQLTAAGVQTIMPENGIQVNQQQLIENGDTLTVQPQPTSPLPVHLTAAAPLSPENGGLQDQELMGDDDGSLDLRVAATKSEETTGNSGKKRRNISSITEKLMMMKKIQQRRSVDE
ncbi:uncharacterized protein [Amphiura filiformis]|uniref:uncharacterized protein n=1 Tax=Amphiura filiformis TaxID=82378 RepID=UPI003B2120D9